MICAECKHWTMGDTWGTNLSGRDHGVVVECMGWCLAKPNKRKRWNYQPAKKCTLFDPRRPTSLIINGEGPATEEQIQQVLEYISVWNGEKHRPLSGKK